MWLEAFKVNYLDALVDVEDHDTIKIVCISNGGTHTSVACARMMSYILRHKCKEPIHLQSDRWAEQGICEGFCDECNSNPCNRRKQEALAKAERMWKALLS